MNNKVFISYAKEDLSFAEKLYAFLVENTYEPWIDKKGLLPGQNWDYEIKKALREANYIILLLSDTSVQKRGYVQREFGIALNYYEEKLEEDIYLIPLKINECEIPQRLSKFQWVEFKNVDSFSLILKSLNVQRLKYNEIEKKLIASKELFEYEDSDELFKYEGSGSINFKINTSYIQFKDETNTNLFEINALIKGRCHEKLISSRKEFYDFPKGIEIIDFESWDWEYEISYTSNLISKSIISINENYHAFTGGAHGNGFVNGLNFNLHPVYEILLMDLIEIEEHEKALDFLSEFCYLELRKLYNRSFAVAQDEINNQKKETLFWEDSLSPKWENFETFLITKQGLEIIFNPYSVSAWSFGINFVLVPYDRLIDILKNSVKIQYLKNNLS